jgi:hypothetical protein
MILVCIRYRFASIWYRTVCLKAVQKNNIFRPKSIQKHYLYCNDYENFTSETVITTYL